MSNSYKPDDEQFEKWIKENYVHYSKLTQSVITILNSLVDNNKINILSIDGRTKLIDSCIEKNKRKEYDNAIEQMTDISGIRIIVFFESDIKMVSEIIEESFDIDKDNSLNQDDLLETNQMGYRSVHYVCKLGKRRQKIPEYKYIESLKFEIQVRTILQHAWAELAHDRNYKFSGVLPKQMARDLNLLSALLENADKGFDILSRQIDSYLKSTSESSDQDKAEIKLNTLTVRQFVTKWARENNLGNIINHTSGEMDEQILQEMQEFGLKNLKELNDIAKPEKTAGTPKTIYQIIRRWMLADNPEKLLRCKNIKFQIPENTLNEFSDILSEDQIDLIRKSKFFIPKNR